MFFLGVAILSKLQLQCLNGDGCTKKPSVFPSRVLKCGSGVRSAWLGREEHPLMLHQEQCIEGSKEATLLCTLVPTDLFAAWCYVSYVNGQQVRDILHWRFFFLRRCK